MHNAWAGPANGMEQHRQENGSASTKPDSTLANCTAQCASRKETCHLRMRSMEQLEKLAALTDIECALLQQAAQPD